MLAKKHTQSDYSKKLLDPRWQKKRLLILSRDEFTCQSCFDTELTLHVHHRVYTPNTNPWDYDDDNFLTLCSFCHENEHEIAKTAQKELYDSFMEAGFLPSDLVHFNSSGKSDFFQPRMFLADAISWLFTNIEAQKILLNLHQQSKPTIEETNHAEGQLLF